MASVLPSRESTGAPFASARRVADGPDRLELGSLWTILRRRTRLFFYVAIIVFDIATLFAVYLPRQYTATAVIVLNNSDSPIAPTSTKEQSEVPSTNSDVETEIAIITSRDIAAKVVNYLHLERDVDLQKRFLSHGGWLQRLGLSSPDAMGPPNSSERARLRELIIGWLAKNLDAERISSAYAISVAFTDVNAIRATAIANAAAHIYTQDQIRQKQATDRQAAQVLGRRIVELRNEAQADFDALQNYRINNNMLSTTGATLTEQEISAYNREVATARAESAAAEAQLRTARQQLSQGSTGDDVGEALSSPVIQDLRVKRAELSALVTQYAGSLGPRNPDLLDAMRRLADVDVQIQGEISRIISNLDAKSRVARQRVSSLSGSLGAAQGALAQNNKAMVSLDDLQRKADASKSLYETYLGRYKETLAATGAERTASRLVSDARIPTAPSSPKVMLILIFGLLLGIGLGLTAAIMAELSFTGFTTGEDVERLLGEPSFGGLPDLKSVKPRGEDPLSTVRDMPRSPFTQAVRGVLAKMRQEEGRSQVVLVTSALPDEGKTTLSACLAQSAARSGERVIAIDCDSTRRQLSNNYAPKTAKSPGLREVLDGSVTIAAAIVNDEKLGFSILPITGTNGHSDPMLDSAKLAILFEQLREHFHLIIVDGAPLLPVAEARELAAGVDRVVLATRWRKTSSHAVRAAIELLPPAVRGRIGVVLSLINMEKQKRFSREGAGAFYQAYKGYYHA